MRRSLALALLAAFCASPLAAKAGSTARPRIMVVGVAHLVAKADLHNATWARSVFDPRMQSQISRLVAGIAAFKPNKVMIEARADNPAYVERYKQYLHRTYRLGPNENDQFGYRLAGRLGLRTIYPIDSLGEFPFDYDSVRAAAAKYRQTAVLAEANSEIDPLVRKSNQLERSSDLIVLMRYLNSAATSGSQRRMVYVHRRDWKCLNGLCGSDAHEFVVRSKSAYLCQYRAPG